MVGFELHEHAGASKRKGGAEGLRRFVQSILSFKARGRQPLVFALSLCVGASWYVTAWFEPALLVLLAVFVVSVSVTFAAMRAASIAPILGLFCLSFSGMSAGALAGKAATLRAPAPAITAPIGPVMVEGWVENIEPGRKGVRLRLLVHAIDGVATPDLPRHIRVTHTNSLRVESGRFVRCWAVLRPPPRPVIKGDYAFHRQAFFEGLSAVGYVQGRCRGGTLGAPADTRQGLSLKIAELRRRLAHYVNAAAGERAGGFAAAVASGDRSFLRQDDQEALRGSGLAHLLAISGLHMGIVGGLIYLMVWRGLALIEPLALRIAVQKPAALAALSASAIYLILSGASVSTQRAFIMALVLFGAILFDRAALSLRSLAIAMILVVILAPWSVLTPGFQMSFAATGALIATYEAWQRRRRARGEVGRRSIAFWFKSLFVTSLVSSLATAPFALYHFERFAGLGLIANLFAMPIISLISAPVAGAALVLSPFGLSEPALRLFGLSLEWVLAIGHAFSRAAPDGVHFAAPMPSSALAAFSAAMVLAMICKGLAWRAVTFSILAALGSFLWWAAPQSAVHWAPSGDVYLVDRSGKVDVITLAKGEGLAPLRYVDQPVTEICLETDCTRDLSGQAILLTAGTDLSCAESKEYALILDANSDRASACPEHISWQDAQRAGGISWRLREGEWVEVQRLSCGVRPWAPC